MPPWGVTLSLSLVTKDQWDPGIGNWHFLLTCRDKKWEEKNNLQDSYSNLIKSAALFLCRVPCCAFVPVCFFSRMLVTTKRRNKRSSSTSFLHLLSKEIISASEMTSRKTAWNCFFFLSTSYQPASMSLRKLPGRQDGFRHFATHRADNGAVLFRDG